MIVVRVELWPGGSEFGKQDIAIAHIGNISNLADTSDYSVRLEEYGSERLDIPYLKTSYSIKGHDRNDSVFALLAKVFSPFLQKDK